MARSDSGTDLAVHLEVLPESDNVDLVQLLPLVAVSWLLTYTSCSEVLMVIRTGFFGGTAAVDRLSRSTTSVSSHPFLCFRLSLTSASPRWQRCHHGHSSRLQEVRELPEAHAVRPPSCLSKLPVAANVVLFQRLVRPGHLPRPQRHLWHQRLDQLPRQGRQHPPSWHAQLFSDGRHGLLHLAQGEPGLAIRLQQMLTRFEWSSSASTGL